MTRSLRKHRLTWILLAAVTLAGLGMWWWNRPRAAEAPQRVYASQSADSEGEGGEEHEHTNRLINETSPYLLQHAHNPVDWHPWGKEAFEKAKREGKPIFLSVGYSTCYWCHVMEKEGL